MWEIELQEALNAGQLAASAVMEIYHTSFGVTIKSDNSPVTAADEAADEIIRNYLKSIFPDHAFLTEESEDDLSRLKNDWVWIVDPVDGTKDFVARNDEFTINIALSYRHEVVVGVVVVPAKNEVYYASKGNGAIGKTKREPPGSMSAKDEYLTVVHSRFHVKEKEIELVKRHADRITHSETYGSCLKACRIASGRPKSCIGSSTEPRNGIPPPAKSSSKKPGDCSLNLRANHHV
jgi:3'(2'), 5'-bisphosphate nucleotidase